MISTGAYNIFTLDYFLWQGEQKDWSLVHRVLLINLNLIQKNKECLGLQIVTDLLFSLACRELAYR